MVPAFEESTMSLTSAEFEMALDACEKTFDKLIGSPKSLRNRDRSNLIEGMLVTVYEKAMLWGWSEDEFRQLLEHVIAQSKYAAAG
jgi:hypothetical protein